MNDWIEKIPLMQAGYHLEMLKKVASLREKEVIYPPQAYIFSALEKTPFSQVKIVIVGQDPYHGEGQANGLAFSVPAHFPPPPSLRNIFREVNEDIYQGESQLFSPDLSRWAEQGVLLLNSTLTVKAKKAGSHHRLGWKKLTDEIIERLGQAHSHLVFMLWGNPAQEKKVLIPAEKHLILEASHPSPLSAFRGFFGCKHFSKANAYLKKHGFSPIIW